MNNTLVSSGLTRYVSRMTQALAAEGSVLKEMLDVLVRQEGLRPLSRRLDIPLGVIRSLMSGRDVSGENLKALAEKLGLEFYIGPPRTPDVMAVGSDDELTPEADAAFLDHFDLQVSAGAGSLGVAEPVDPVPFSAKWLRRHGLRPNQVSVLEVRGDSQEPVLFDGDFIIVDKATSKPKTGQLYVVVRRDSVQVKWVHVLRNAVQLISENPSYPPERVEAHEAPEFYKVRWFSHFLR